MTTFAIMQTAIADELVNEPVTTTQIKTAINRAIRHYRHRPFFFNQSRTGAFNTVVDQEYYTATDLAAIATLSRIIAMRTTITGTTGMTNPVQERSFNDIDDLQDGTMKGVPSYHAYFDNSIRLWPIPNAVLAITFSYYQRFAELSADSDTNAWLTDGEELIRQRAKIILALDNLHSDEIAERCVPLEQAALSALNAETRRRMGDMILRPETMPVLPVSFDINRGT